MHPLCLKPAERFEGCQGPLEPESQTLNHHGGEGTRAGSLARATVLSTSAALPVPFSSETASLQLCLHWDYVDSLGL